MSVSNTLRRYLTDIETIGKNTLNILYPNDFELYVIAFEVVNRSGVTEEYFIFPILPSNIKESKPQGHNIKQSLGGITVLSNPSFIPTDITISGNFGRSFKILLGDNFMDLYSGFRDESGNINILKKNDKLQTYDKKIKTGYGCCKILEAMIEKVRKPTNGEQYKLIFHNLALGNSYIVVPQTLTFSQSQQSNMIWEYDLPMKSVAPLNFIRTAEEIEKSRKDVIATNFAQNKANDIVNGLASFLNKSELTQNPLKRTLKRFVNF